MEVDEFEKNRCNVIATYGNKDDIALILNGHMDVVPAFGEWEYPPDQGIRKDGILHGRGSCDMLGGIAAILRAAQYHRTGKNNPKKRSYGTFGKR